MTQAQKPHSTLDEARTLIADYEDLGTVERIRHGDEYTHDAVELLKSLIEQYGTLERHLDELARAAEKFWHEVEHNEFVHFGEFERAIDRARRAQASSPASEPRNRPGAGWQEHTLCVCGGYEAGDHHFDRSLCACGAMHYYCNRCGSQGDSCDSDPAKMPAFENREELPLVDVEPVDVEPVSPASASTPTDPVDGTVGAEDSSFTVTNDPTGIVASEPESA